jgi:hypothetical protein
MEALAAELDRSSVEVETFAELVENLEEVTTRDGKAIHPVVKWFADARERHARVAALGVNAGLAQARTRLLEQQAEVVAQVLRSVTAWCFQQLRAGPRDEQHLRVIEAQLPGRVGAELATAGHGPCTKRTLQRTYAGVATIGSARRVGRALRTSICIARTDSRRIDSFGSPQPRGRTDGVRALTL